MVIPAPPMVIGFPNLEFYFKIISYIQVLTSDSFFSTPTWNLRFLVQEINSYISWIYFGICEHKSLFVIVYYLFFISVHSHIIFMSNSGIRQTIVYYYRYPSFWSFILIHRFRNGFIVPTFLFVLYFSYLVTSISP